MTMAARSRVPFVAILLLASVGCSASKGASVDPLAPLSAEAIAIDPLTLIRAETTIAFRAQVDPLRNSAVGDLVAPLVRNNSDFASLIDAADECYETLHGVEVMGAFDLSRDDDDDAGLIAVTGPGLGNDERLQCMGQADDSSELQIVETRGDVRLSAQGTGGRLIALSEDTVMIVGKDWDEHVLAAIETPSMRAPDGPLTRAVASDEGTADGWFAMLIQQSDRDKFSSVPGGEAIETMRVEWQLDSGLDMRVVVAFADVSGADLFREFVTTVLDNKAKLEEAGTPPALLDSIRLEGVGRHAILSATVTDDELPQVSGWIVARGS